MIYTYRFFVVSNNTTKKLEKKKALSIISQVLEGFTVYDAVGYWKGTQERSMIVETMQDEEQEPHMQTLARDIAHALKQDAVALDKIPSTVQFIS